MAKKQVNKEVPYLKQAKELYSYEEKEMDFKGIKFNLKSNIPMEDKISIIESCVRGSIMTNDETSVKYYNEIIRDAIFDVMVCKYFTNLKIDDDIFKNYDALDGSGLLDYIMENIETESLDDLWLGVEKRTEEELRVLDREQQFGNILMSLVKNINEAIPRFTEELKNFDPSKLEFLKEFNNNLNANKKKKLQ